MFDSDEQRAEKLEQQTAALLEATEAKEAASASTAIALLETEEDCNKKVTTQKKEIDRWRGKCHANIAEREEKEAANTAKLKAAIDAQQKRAAERGASVKRKIDEHADDAKKQADATRPTEEVVAALRSKATVAWAALKDFYAANSDDPTAEVYEATLKPFALRLALEDKDAATAKYAKIRAMNKTASVTATKEAAPVAEAKEVAPANGGE